MNNLHVFSVGLLQWNKWHNKRRMPWKGETNAYKIWLSEIILQQTRVEQGRDYYLRFIKKYPSVQKLAAAKDVEVFKLWEGLGYYNRCRNLLITARYIVSECNNQFPQTYEEILALKGIGPYTASAICSFAYNLPYAVLDGNVYRVLARYFGISVPIDSSAGKAEFSRIAQLAIDKNRPAVYNQAIMDFGATVCKPLNPECTDCPLQNNCHAHEMGLANHLPVKEKRLSRKLRYFVWLRINVKNKTLVYQRTEKDIWHQLFEFYLIETQEKPIWNENTIKDFCQNVFCGLPTKIKTAYRAEQQLTHQKIKAEIIEIEFTNKPAALAKQMWLSKTEIEKLAFPKIISDYLNAKTL